jgi:PTH1 family peptidyl-tRNA hydrolase
VLADALAAAWDFGAFRRSGPARVSRGTVDGTPVQLLKPQTFMNRSGGAVRHLVADPEFDARRDLLILVDEAALPLGTYRLRPRGSNGGHRGLESVETAVGSREYARLRIGVGPQPATQLMEDYVLEEFTGAELAALRDLLPALCDAVTCWVTEGIEVAMNRFNRRPRPTG